MESVADQPQIVLLYFDRVDSIGHTNGPDDSLAIATAVQVVNDAVDYLLQQVRRSKWLKTEK